VMMRPPEVLGVLLLALTDLPLLASFSFAPPCAKLYPLQLELALAPSALRARCTAIRGARSSIIMSTPPAFLLQIGESARALGSPPRAAERRVNGVLAQQRQLAPKPVLDLGMLESFLHERGNREIHARVLYKWLFERKKKGTPTPQQHDWTYDAMPGDLPADLRAALVKEFVPMSSRVIETAQSASGGFKLMIQLQVSDGVKINITKHENA
jgi:hypothetical protein